MFVRKKKYIETTSELYKRIEKLETKSWQNTNIVEGFIKRMAKYAVGDIVQYNMKYEQSMSYGGNIIPARIEKKISIIKTIEGGYDGVEYRLENGDRVLEAIIKPCKCRG